MTKSEKNTLTQHFFFRNITLLVASSMTVMAGAIIAPVLPLMNEIFHTTPHSELLVKLILSTPAIFIALFAPFSGYILDKYGRKNVFILSLIIYGIGGSSGYFVENIYLIIAGRVFLGMGVAGIMTTTTTLIGDYFTDDNRNKFLGLQSTFMAFGGMIFLILGGVLADVSWNTPFLVYAFAFILLPAVIIFIFEPDLEEEKKESKANTSTTVCLKKFIIIFMVAFTGMLILYMIPIHLPFFLKSIDHLSNTQLGISISSFIFISGLTSSFYQKISKRLDNHFIFILTLFLIGTGYISIIFASNALETMLYLSISAVGQGLLFPNLAVTLINIAPVETRGRAIGGLTTSIFTAQFLCPLITQPIVQALSITTCFVIGGCLALCMGTFFIFYKNKCPTNEI